MSVKMSELFDEKHILAPLAASTRDELFSVLAKALAQLDNMDERQIKEGIVARELMMSTVIGPGIAFPHAQFKGLGRSAGVLAVIPAGCDYGDGNRIKVAAMLVDDSLAASDHWETLQRFGLLARNPRFLEKICAAATPAQAHAVIKRLEMTS